MGHVARIGALVAHLFLDGPEVDIAQRGVSAERQRNGNAGGLALGHARRDLTGHLLCVAFHRVMSARNDEIVDALREKRTVGGIIVPAPADTVREMPPAGDILFGHDVLAFQQAGLPDAELLGRAQHLGVLEAGDILAREGQHIHHALAALVFGSDHTFGR